MTLEQLSFQRTTENNNNPHFLDHSNELLSFHGKSSNVIVNYRYGNITLENFPLVDKRRAS